MPHVLVLALLAPLASGCARKPDLFQEPSMSPVGSGFAARTDPAMLNIDMPRANTGSSLFQDGAANLFTDPRASKIGDVITVSIFINDKASFGNTSGRSQTAQETGSFDWSFGLGSNTHKVNSAADINASSSSNGQGTIDRSEKIQMSVAAVVTRVLPNGNLVINGSQEVRVNFEMRQLQIAGIVRPRDISSNNMISYEKIAEARISYGGKGRITEVQQPSWGQQIFDAAKPF
ncbi:flagellar biosynthesis protein FlgH [Rhodoblastus sphagnicola]|uniref:Flagellar L-ring protein n=1 Tax=Rhodoblastus sphagnicola TaxID=333368 RepID=A0A2S6NCP3_9HYPH|nr:flagellar biosynthesis protein FlgH [Rhodoblastus sphagnicola]